MITVCHYVKSHDNKKILYIDADNLFGHSLSQLFAHEEIKLDEIDLLKDILNTPDDSDISHFVGVDLEDRVEIKQKPENVPFCPRKKSGWIYV